MSIELETEQPLEVIKGQSVPTPGLVQELRSDDQALDRKIPQLELEPSDLEDAKVRISRLEHELAEAVEEREILRTAVLRLLRSI